MSIAGQDRASQQKRLLFVRFWVIHDRAAKATPRRLSALPPKADIRRVKRGHEPQFGALVPHLRSRKMWESSAIGHILRTAKRADHEDHSHQRRAVSDNY